MRTKFSALSIIYPLLLLMLLLLLLPVTARADAIVLPDNDFFMQHQSEIVLLGRSFSAIGGEGGVPVRNAPNDRRESAKLQDGEVVFIQYSCLCDGEYWGLAYEPSGWVKLSQMLVVYDYIAFEEEHLSEFYPYSGDYAAVRDARAAIVWAWPGTDVPPLWTYKDLDIDYFGVSHAYMDNEGREWGFIMYLYGNRNIWICLSDPLDSDIPAFNPAPAPGIWESDTEHTDIGSAQSNGRTIVIIAVLVAVLVIGTAILIKILWKNGHFMNILHNN